VNCPMNASNRTLDEQLVALKPKALDEFSRKAIEGARRALADDKNPLRLNFFSTALRILFEHTMAELAPPELVEKTRWFSVEREDGKPTRKQRIAYAIQGGLDDVFIKNELRVDVYPLQERLLNAVDDLSKQVHGREETIVEDSSEQEAAARVALNALENFFEAFHACRSAILEPIRDELDEAAIDALVSETIQEIDELASHHSVDEINVDETYVKRIGPESITYCAVGSIDVTLQWGSNSDVRRGDGVEVGDSFSFRCEIDVMLEDPWDLRMAETIIFVDTKSWRDDRGPDDE
jgi:Predicted pPIWI-associating nuclease